MVTVTTTDPEKARILEPGASPPDQRLEVIRRAREAGFRTGVMAMPLCPGITLTAENTGPLFAAARDAGAEFIYAGGVTLRPGKQKDLFITEVVRAHYGDLEPLYTDLFSENRQSGMPRAADQMRSARAIHESLAALGENELIPHSIYRDILCAPDALFVLFCHMQSLFATRGVDVRPLRAATDRYAAWLSSARSALGRKKAKVVASDPFPVSRILCGMLEDLCADNGRKLESLIGNERLARLASSMVESGGFFDYPSLSVKFPALQ
jgi:hypothetical protein